ncbi:MAG: hypothetical protein KJ056_02070, partial [Acidimicrobiia bacterium]|nr:hypothetical protein [Acidimicrobiia bacterium]
EQAGRPIMWGMPDLEVFEASRDGTIDVAIGGCCVPPDPPTHRCSNCGLEYVVVDDRPSSDTDADGPGPGRAG